MNEINAARSIVPLGEFKAKASSILRSLKEPVVVTQNGKAAAVVLSPELYEEMREDRRYFEAVAIGLAENESGNKVNHSAVKKWLKSWGTDNPVATPK